MPTYLLPKLALADRGLIRVMANGGNGADQGIPLGMLWNEGLVAASAPMPELDAGLPRMVLWSGGLGEGLFGADPRTWMQGGWAALESELARASSATGEEGRLCIRPHSRHVVSDTPGVTRLLREHSEVEVLLDPAAMLTAAMLPSAEDHLERMLSTLGLHPRVVGVVVANVKAPTPAGTLDDEPALEIVALNDGVLDAAMIRRLVDAWVPAGVARVEMG